MREAPVARQTQGTTFAIRKNPSLPQESSADLPRPLAPSKEMFFLKAPPGCKEPEIIECLKRFASPSLEPADISRLSNEGLKECFPSHELDDLIAYQSCLPVDVGKDQRNMQVLAFKFECGDSCPMQGIVFPAYRYVKRWDCCESGGFMYRHQGWRPTGYVGCVPPELSLRLGHEYPCAEEPKPSVPEPQICPPGDPLCSSPTKQ